MITAVNCGRIMATVAILLCGLLFAMDNDSAAKLCAFSGSCDAVRTSEYGKWFGVPLPILGMIAFAFQLLLITLDSSRLNRMRAISSLVIIGFSGYFLIVQAFVLQKICMYCLAIDLLGIALGSMCLCFFTLIDSEPKNQLRYLWLPANVIVFLIPTWLFLLSVDRVPPPEVISAWIEGKINVVEVTDFDCEYCQQAEKILETIKNSPDVNFVRLVAPMPKHINSRSSGRAFFAAKKQGKAELMATELFRAKDRSREGCRKIAAKLNLDLEEFDRSTEDSATDQIFEETISWAKAAGTGLPLIWVNVRHFSGTPDAADFESAMMDERKRLQSK